MIDFLVAKALLAEGRQKSETNAPRTYEVKKARLSESTLVFFARCCDTQQRLVIKILRDYEDTRYSLTDPQKRLACQIEALLWNQKITPGIYLGLGRVVEPDLSLLKQIAEGNPLHYITIENIIDDVQQLYKITNPEAEYALVMECLPKERRLDFLLRQKNTSSIYELLEILVKRVVKMHELAPHVGSSSSEDKEGYWGSYEQLKEKLYHNIGLFDNLAYLDDRSFYETYSWLKEKLKEIIENPELQYYLSERFKQNFIKRCHGDLKARNIWIESKEHSPGADHRVRILDAIDFNPSYCNIDVLSDIAMLAVDVQAVDKQLHEHDDLSKRGNKLAQFIVKAYCGQAKDKATKIVLTYYLLEKSLVRASISLFYDRSEHPQLGAYFLKIAVDYMSQLKGLLHSTVPSPVKELTSPHGSQV
jgi:aminoglycoside phosphotransferase family enzyme